MPTRIKSTPKPEPIIITNFNGVNETQATGELPYAYAKHMINAKVEDNLNIKQRPGTVALWEGPIGAGRVTAFETVHLSQATPENFFDVSDIEDDYSTSYVIDGDKITVTDSGLNGQQQTSLRYKFATIPGVRYNFYAEMAHVSGQSMTPVIKIYDTGYIFEENLNDEDSYDFTATQEWFYAEFNIFVTGETVNEYENITLEIDEQVEQALWAIGDGLYRKYIYNIKDGEDPTLVGSGFNRRSVDLVEFQDSVLAFNGENYKIYDGSSMANVVGKIPTVSIQRTYNGASSTEYEELNYLSDGFTDSFNGDGTNTSFTLSYDTLNATTVVCYINTVEVVEGVGFTVNRTTGIIDFSAGTSPHGAPATGSDNVLITGHQDDIPDVDRIAKCRFGIAYSGTNDTRIFCAGNPDYPNRVFYSDLFDATYFPVSNSSIVGDDHKITGFVKQYDELIIVKSKGIYVKQYAYDDTVGVYFPQRTLNSKKGSPALNQITLVGNNPFILSDSGLYEVYVSDETNERNVELISQPINTSLLAAEISQAICYDFENKHEYWICIDEVVWIYNYLFKVWYVYTNIDVGCFSEINGELYFGKAGSGFALRFDEEVLNDWSGHPTYDTAIESYWESDFWGFGREDLYKNLDTMSLSVEKGANVRVDVILRTEEGADEDIEFFPDFSLIDFGNVDFGNFTFSTSHAPYPEPLEARIKKMIYLKIIFKNYYLNSTMNISSFMLAYRLGSKVR